MHDNKLIKLLSKVAEYGVVIMNLSNIKGAQTILDNELKDEIDRMADDPGVKIISEQYYTIIIFDFQLFDQYKCKRLFQLFASYIFETFHYSMQLKFDSQAF